MLKHDERKVARSTGDEIPIDPEDAQEMEDELVEQIPDSTDAAAEVGERLGTGKTIATGGQHGGETNDPRETTPQPRRE